MAVTLIMSGKVGTRSYDKVHGYVADESDAERIVKLLNEDPEQIAAAGGGSTHFWHETVHYWVAPW